MKILRIVLWCCIFSILLFIFSWKQVLIQSERRAKDQSYREEKKLESLFLQTMIGKFNPDMVWKNELERRERQGTLFTKDFQEILHNKIIGVLGDIEDIEKVDQDFIVHFNSLGLDDRLRFLLKVEKDQLSRIEILELQKDFYSHYFLVVNINNIEASSDAIMSCYNLDETGVECESDIRKMVIAKGEILDILKIEKMVYSAVNQNEDDN